MANSAPHAFHSSQLGLEIGGTCSSYSNEVLLVSGPRVGGSSFHSVVESLEDERPMGIIRSQERVKGRRSDVNEK